MTLWDRTHGKETGAYLRAGASELYVRRDGDMWVWYVDGILMGAERGEEVARAASEAAVRAMARTHTARVAAAADQPDRAA
jgi:hypothetical protein